MFKKYIGTKIIQAQPRIQKKDTDEMAQDGYNVIYENGYESFSPKGVFEKAYRLIDNMNFGLAIEALKKGLKVARKGWNGRGIFIELQVPDENSKMSSPYIFIDTTGLQTDNINAPKSLVPWLASQTDMLADDWVIIGEDEHLK